MPPLVFGSLEAVLRRHRSMFTVQGNGAGARVGVATLTPFRGADGHRVFGDFRCSGGACRHRWGSGYTYCDTWQQCRVCEAKIYPYAQRPLEQRADDDEEEERGPHDNGRCGRCLSGRSCTAAGHAAASQTNCRYYYDEEDDTHYYY